MNNASKALAGIALGVAACACFSALDTTTKFVSKSVPLLMALWFRYAFQAVATAVVVMPQRGWSVWRTRHLPFQLLRGALLLAGSFMAFTMHLSTGWVSVLIASIALPFVWIDLPHWWQWAALCFMGLTPFLYSQIASSMLGGWLVFLHVPDNWAFVGMGLIAVCGAASALLTVREQRDEA